MSTITSEKIKKLSQLAHLDIPKNNEEITKISRDLSAIFDMVEKINAVDTQNIAPLAHSMENTSALRQDKITEKNNRDNLQQLTSFTQDGFYIVPQVIEE